MCAKLQACGVEERAGGLVARAERSCCIPLRACRRPRCTARLPASHNTHARTHAHAWHSPIRSGDSTQRRRRARRATPRPSGGSMQHATCNMQNTSPAVCSLHHTSSYNTVAAHTPAVCGDRCDASGGGAHAMRRRRSRLSWRARSRCARCSRHWPAPKPAAQLPGFHGWFCAVSAARPSVVLPCRTAAFARGHGCRSIGFEKLRRWMDGGACAIIAIASASARARFTRDTRSPAGAAPNIHPRRPRVHASRGNSRWPSEGWNED